MTLVFIQGLLGAILVYLSFHFGFHPLKEENKRTIARVKRIIIACILAVFVVSLFQYRSSKKSESESSSKISALATNVTELTQHLTDSRDEISYLKKEIVVLNQAMADMITDFSTNNSIVPQVRLAILDDQQKKIETEINQLAHKAPTISVSLPDITTIRSEREHRLRLTELQAREKEILRAKSQIKEQEEQAKAKAAQLQEEQKAREDAIRKENEETKKYLDVFDHAIKRLHAMLIVFSKDTGQELISDFPGGLPSAYNSGFVDNGRLVRAKHTIGIGTNAAWTLNISTVRQSQFDGRNTDSVGMPKRIWRQSLPFALEITSSIRAGPSKPVLSITPLVDRVSIKLSAASTKIIDSIPSTADYETNLDAAVTALLDALDERWPLPTAKKPAAK